MDGAHAQLQTLILAVLICGLSCQLLIVTFNECLILCWL